MRCQGDSGMNDPFGMKKQDSAMEFHLNELENKVKDLEMQVLNYEINDRLLLLIIFFVSCSNSLQFTSFS